MQVFDRESGTLTIAAQRGFEAPFLNFFATVRSGHAAACGAAMSAAERVIVEDVTQSDISRGEPALDVLVSAGVGAVQSTPLVSSRGEVVGMISTHFTQPHRPDERDLGVIDLLARQAADLIERNHAENVLREEFRNTQILHDLSARSSRQEISRRFTKRFSRPRSTSRAPKPAPCRCSTETAMNS